DGVGRPAPPSPGVRWWRSRSGDGPRPRSLAVELGDRRFPALERLLDMAAAAGWKPAQRALDAAGAGALERLRVGRHPDHVDRNGPLGAGAQLVDPVEGLIDVVAAPAREPAVAEAEHPVERGRPLA